MDDRTEAEEALAALRDTQHRLADRTRWSLARHAVVGAMMAMIVAATLLPTAGQVAVTAAVLAIVALVAARDRRRDGYFVNGYHPGATRGIAIGTALGCTALYFAGLAAANTPEWRWAVWVLAAIAFVGATAASLGWERVYRATLRTDAS